MDLRLTEELRKKRSVTKEATTSSVSVVKFTLLVVKLTASNIILAQTKEDRNAVSKEKSINGQNIRMILLHLWTFPRINCLPAGSSKSRYIRFVYLTP